MANSGTGRGVSPMASVNGVIDDLHRSLGLADSDFFCECGHSGCKERITLTRAEYSGLRHDDRLVLAAAHADRDSGAVAELHELRGQVHQLQGALASRAMIEQAKGVLAQQRGITPHTAFQILRQRARDEGRSLSEICAETVAAVERTTDKGSAEQTLATRDTNRSSDPRGR